jgi:hypothetical protein
LVAHSSTSAQVAAVSVPALHDDGPETVYPEAHVGWQVLPDASVLVQSPAAPLRGAVAALHGSAAQVAAVSVPVMHDDGPETVYPEAHVGWQVVPDASAPLQSPTAPLVGAPGASQWGSQVAAVSVPTLHDDGPETVYPVAHAGWQVLPDASVLVQSPAPLLGGGGGARAPPQKPSLPVWSASLQKT